MNTSLYVRRYFITVRWHFVGFHSYVGAPQDVAFLRHVHRHLFKVAVRLQISDPNRGLEFFQVQAKLRSICEELESGSHACSCEMFAEKILNRVMTELAEAGWQEDTQPGFTHSCTVSEDGENDGTYEHHNQAI